MCSSSLINRLHKLLAMDPLVYFSNGSLKDVFENILKAMVSLASISQALGSPSQQRTIFSVSLRPSWKASIGGEHVISAFLDVEKAFDNV